MSYAACPACGRRVLKARSEVHGYWILLDPQPNPEGNQAVQRPPSGPLQTRQLHSSKGDKPRAYETVYMPHVATCGRD